MDLFLLLIIKKSNLTDKIKWDFFQIIAVSKLLYGWTTWTLMKCIENKWDGNYENNTLVYWLLTVLVSKTSVYYRHWKKHPHWEILPFLFYYLLTSAGLPNLFSYPFDTILLTYLCIHVPIHYIWSHIPIQIYSPSHAYVCICATLICIHTQIDMLTPTHICIYTRICAPRDRRGYSETIG